MICSDIDPYSRKSIIRLYCIVNGIIVDNMATIYILCMKETGRHVSMLRQQERTLGSRVLEGIGASRLVSLPLRYNSEQILGRHDDVIKWKHFPRNWPFVRGIHRSSVNSLHKGQWRGALMFSLICVWINDWVNNREAGDLRRYLAHYDVIVMEEYWLRAICVKNFHIAAKFDRRQGSTAAAEPSLSLLFTTLTVCPILYLFHNSDVIMSPMASQITSLTIVCSTVYSVADQKKHQSSASPVTGEFPAQMASNAENVSIWWRHHVLCGIAYLWWLYPWSSGMYHWHFRYFMIVLDDMGKIDQYLSTRKHNKVQACTHFFAYTISADFALKFDMIPVALQYMLFWQEYILTPCVLASAQSVWTF